MLPYLEPFGLVPLEAMACGTPIVAVKEGRVKESVVHLETGLLIERDENEFAEALTELIVNDAKHRFMSQRATAGHWNTRQESFFAIWHAP